MAGKRTKGRKGAKKKYQIEMTSFSIFIWTFCLFFLLTWIFVLGILVGRGFFPSAVTAISDIKGQIGKLQGMVGQNKSPEPAPTKKKASDPKLAFYDRLSNKKEVAQKKPTEVPHVSRKPLKAKKETKPKPPPQAPRPAPKLGKTVEKPKNEVTSPSRSARYTIQLASLELVSQAEKMSSRLVKQGFPAYFYDVEVKGKTYYRVRCGRFVTRKEAEVFVKKLKSEAGIKGFVTRLE